MNIAVLILLLCLGEKSMEKSERSLYFTKESRSIKTAIFIES
jgi:hypothetical protein